MNVYMVFILKNHLRGILVVRMRAVLRAGGKKFKTRVSELVRIWHTTYISKQ